MKSIWCVVCCFFQSFNNLWNMIIFLFVVLIVFLFCIIGLRFYLIGFDYKWSGSKSDFVSFEKNNSIFIFFFINFLSMLIFNGNFSPYFMMEWRSGVVARGGVMISAYFWKFQGNCLSCFLVELVPLLLILFLAMLAVDYITHRIQAFEQSAPGDDHLAWCLW